MYDTPRLWIVIVKISIRVVFIIYSFFQIFHILKFENNFELFLTVFLSLSSLSDFIFLKDFLSSDNYISLVKDPKNFSLIYSIYYQVCKVLLITLISYSIVIFKTRKELDYLSRVFPEIRKDFYFYFCLLLKMLKNIESYDLNNLFDFISKIYYNLKEHSERCKLDECNCSQIVKLLGSFVENQIIDKIGIKRLLKDFCYLILINISSTIKGNEQKTLINFLLSEVYFFYYFKNFTIRTVFNLQKLDSVNIIRKNKLVQMRLSILKNDITNASIIFNNKKIVNDSLIKLTEEELELDYYYSDSIKILYVNFNKFYEYQTLKEKIEECFKKYKIICQKFFMQVYIFHEFQEDLNNLIKTLKKCNKASEMFFKDYRKLSFLEFKIISIYHKFFFNDDLSLKFPQYRRIKNEVESNDSSSSLHNINNIISQQTFKETLILKPNIKQQIVFEKITSNFCYDLGYSSKEILSKQLVEFIPGIFCNIHDSLVHKFIKSNKLAVKEKEVYFITKEGYCINYKLNASVFLTLNQDILFFCEIEKISELNPNFRQTAFVSCLNDGSILCFDYGFKKHLYIDSYILNLVPLNIFKNILCLNRQATEQINDLKTEYNFLTIDYNDLLNNIKEIDFSKIIDLRSQYYDNNTFMKKITNAINFSAEGTCTIEVFKRILDKNVILDIRIDFSNVMKMNYKLNMTFEKFLENRSVKAMFIPSKDDMIVLNKEKEFFKLFLKNIKNITIIYINNQHLILKNLKTLQELSEEYTSTENEKKTSVLYFSIKKFFKENHIENKEMEIHINFYNRFFVVIIFLGFFVTGYYFLNGLNDELYSKTRNFIDFSCLSIILKYYTITLNHSFYSLGLVKDLLEQKTFYYNSKEFDNSIEFHYNLIKERADYFLENSFKFQNLYNTYGSYLLEANDTIYDVFEISELNSDWSTRFKNYSLQQNMFLFHYLTDRISLNDVYTSKFHYLNYHQNNFTTVPTNTDMSLYFYFNDILGKISSAFNKVIQYSETNFSNYLDKNNTEVFVVYLCSGICALIYSCYEAIRLYFFNKQIFLQFFTIYNQIKVYHSTLIKKFELIEEIFNDYTEELINETKKNSKLLRLKLRSETFGSTENLPGQLKKVKKNYNVIDNSNEDYYKNSQSFTKLDLESNLQTPQSELTGSHNRLNPNSKINAKLFKVFSNYKSEIAKIKANKQNFNPDTNLNNKYLNINNKPESISNITLINSVSKNNLSVNNNETKKALINNSSTNISKNSIFAENTKNLIKQFSSNIQNPINTLQASLASDNKLITKDFCLDLNNMNKSKHHKSSKNENNKSLADLKNKVLEKKIITQDEEQINQEKHKDYFTNSHIFIITFRVLLFLLLFVLITSVIVFTFVLNAYSEIFDNYKIARNVLLRNTYINELLLIYRNSVMNKKIINDNFTDSIEDLFDLTYQKYQIYFKNTKSFVDSENSHLIDIKEIEKNLNSKNMCNYYSYYMTNSNSTTLEEYQNYYEKCTVLGGGLNIFGLENSLQSMISILLKNKLDLSSLLNKNNQENNNDWNTIILEKYGDETFQKVYKNNLEIIFDINQKIYEKIFKYNDYFYDDLGVKHDWVHYMLFLIVGLVNFFYLFIVKYLIDRPKFIILYCEDLIQNSILFNVLDI